MAHTLPLTRALTHAPVYPLRPPAERPCAPPARVSSVTHLCHKHSILTAPRHKPTKYRRHMLISARVAHHAHFLLFLSGLISHHTQGQQKLCCLPFPPPRRSEGWRLEATGSPLGRVVLRLVLEELALRLLGTVGVRVGNRVHVDVARSRH